MARKGTRSRKRILLWVIGGLVVVFALMQAVPYGRSHTNPPAVKPFTWTDPQAKTIAVASCYDCHSNETKWWWGTKIAPFSWLVQADLDEGRARFNFSDYQGQPSVEEFQRALDEGMPPFQYTVIHWNARLSATQKQTLVKGYADGMTASGGSSNGAPQGPAAAQGTTRTTSLPSGVDAATMAAINQSCGGCHSANSMLNVHAGNTAQAQALIDDMIRRGAKATAEQQQLLIRYFTR